MALHILPRKKTPLAEFALEFFLIGTLHRSRSGVNFQVIEDFLGTGKPLSAHFALQIAGLGGVKCDVLPIRQPGIILLQTFLTLVHFFVGVVHLQVVFQVIFAVETAFAVRTLVTTFVRMNESVTHELKT